MTPEKPSASTLASGNTSIPPGAGVIKLDGHVSASAVEDHIAQTEDAFWRLQLIYVDLSDALYFEVPGLLRLLSAVADRRVSKKQTMFSLPEDNLARHILRLWDFPQAVSVVARTPFRLLVERDDWEHFGEDWPVLQVHPQATSPQASVLAYLVERRSFGLTPYKLGGKPGLERMVQDQTEKWSSYALASLLSALLPAPTADFARVVVREMLTNVAHNAASTIAVVGSQLDLFRHAETGAPAGLTVAVWHNGSTAIDMFTSCAEKLASADGEIAIGESVAVEPGLMALCRTAIDTFGGIVEVRGGDRKVVIERRPEESSLFRSTPGLAPISGDIVTVRLPINNA
jgi:hypothetical protein